MSDLSELIRQKENLLEQIQALEETCEGIENENNAKRVQELNLQQARLVVQKQEVAAQLACLETQLSVINKRRIEDDMNLQTQHYLNQISSISQRQTQVIDAFLQSKDKILEQTGQITMQMLENIKVQSTLLDMRKTSG